MKWKLLTNKGAHLSPSFPSKEKAASFWAQLPESIKKSVVFRYESEDKEVMRMVNEGMLKGDLYRILLPKISIDEYVPSDSNTDNIVLAFFIKGVPEAIIPFKEFCMKCDGVIDVDYGDSETIPSTSVVYLEFNREKENVKNIEELIDFVSILADLEPADFTITFPDTDDKFPYNAKVMQKYFERRDKQKNKEAQQAALDKSEESDNSEEEDGDDETEVPDGMTKRTEATESLIERLINITIGDF